MDYREEINHKGDQYARRMMIRKKETTMDCYSKSLRRRLNIMEAIRSKSELTPSTLGCNPFQKEFSNGSDYNSEQSKSYVVSWPVAEEQQKQPQHRNQYKAKCPQSLSDSHSVKSELRSTPESSNKLDDDSGSSEEYRRAGQFHEKTKPVIEQPGRRSTIDLKDDDEQRVSLGEYFGSKSHKDLIRQNFLDEFFKDKSKRDSVGPDVLFGNRVLEVLEPEVVNAERKSNYGPSSHRRASELTLVQENFAALELQPDSALDESTTTSFVSEDIREIDREIDALLFQPDVLEAERLKIREDTASQQKIFETPKRLNVNPELVRRMSDNFTPKKLFHANGAENKDDTKRATDVNYNMTKTLDESQKQNISDKEPFTTAVPIPNSQLNNFDYNHQRPGHQEHDTSAMSFLKRNTSFLMNKFNVRNKPNLESTRKSVNKTPHSQIGTTISTLTLPNTPSSPYTYQNQSQPYENLEQHQQQHQTALPKPSKAEAAIPIEVENFLQLALGDEQYNSTVNSDMKDRSHLQMNASEIILPQRTPIEIRKLKLKVPMTEPPRHSSTLNRTYSAYKSLTQRIKKKFRGSAKLRHDDEEEDANLSIQSNILPVNLNPNLAESVKELLNIMNMQQAHITQASKALDVCLSQREFMASTERVESERALILANLCWKAAQDEITRLHSQQTDRSLYCERGEVILSDLSLRLREDVLRRDKQAGEGAEWLFIVVSEGPTVLATKVQQCTISGTRLYFSEKLSIPGLTPDFRLSVSVYSLRLQMIEYSHEEKYHLKESDDNRHSVNCPSPQALLGRSKRRIVVSPTQNRIRYSDIKKSSFVMCGSVDLMLHDLNLKSPWPLMGVPIKSVLYGTIDMSLKCNLQLSVSHAGFLTHGGEAGGLASWSRRWCVLEGHKLLFWNYPCEQQSQKNQPLYVINLLKCVSRRIGVVDRSLCAKSRTLLVETSRQRQITDSDSLVIECRSSYTIVRNLLSCDTNQDLTEWQSKLNHVISSLRQWSIINSVENDSFSTSGIFLS